MPKQKSDTNIIDKQIGANLARLRAMRGMSQADLGERLSTAISYQAISKYENGTTRIPSSNLAEFAVMLECRVCDLFEGVEGILRDGEPFKGMKLDKKGEKLMRDYQLLNSAVLQDAIGNMAHALVLELTNGFKNLERKI